MRIFLKLKAWQLFVLFFSMHLFIMMGLRIMYYSPSVIVWVIPIGMVVFIALFMAWFWSLGTNINRKVSQDIRPNPRFFRFGLTYSFVYVVVFQALSALLSRDVFEGVLRIIMPFHLFAVFCIFYAAYFVAKNLVMAERNERVGFYECAGPFFLIWVYPVGVWLIQPRVNRMFQNHADPEQAIEGDAS